MMHPTDCQLCARLAEGHTKTKNGTDISPLCPNCEVHHFESVFCRGEKLPEAVCPRCKKNIRELEDIFDSGRWEKKRYARYCAACLVATGYVRREMNVSLQSGPYLAVQWVLPAGKDDISTDDLFRMAGRSVRAKR
jgi:hypothetical protein